MAGWAAGIFTRARNWVNDKNGAINPQASLFDQEDDNFAAGLNNCVTKDGLNKPSATMDFNAQRLSNLGAATADNDALSRVAAGTFTGTLTGMSGATTGTVSYQITGMIVTLYLEAAITGTSNTTALTMTGLPAAIRPTAVSKIAWVHSLIDVSTVVAGNAAVDTSGTITFAIGRVSGANLVGNQTGFTASNTKGLGAGFTMTYPLR